MENFTVWWTAEISKPCHCKNLNRQLLSFPKIKNSIL